MLLATSLQIKQNQLYTNIFPSASNNNALLRCYEICTFSMGDRARLDAVFNEFRSIQHLGCVVHAVLDTRFCHLGLY